MASKTGPRAKAYNGASHQTFGGPVRWSKNRGNTLQPTSSGLRWNRVKPARRSSSLSTIVHPHKTTSCPDGGRPPVDHSAKTEPTATVIYCRVKTDKRSRIVNDPNRADDPQYILRLLAKVISVSLETVKLVEGLPELGIEKAEPVVDA